VTFDSGRWEGDASGGESVVRSPFRWLLLRDIALKIGGVLALAAPVVALLGSGAFDTAAISAPEVAMAAVLPRASSAAAPVPAAILPPSAQVAVLAPQPRRVAVAPAPVHAAPAAVAAALPPASAPAPVPPPSPAATPARAVASPAPAPAPSFTAPEILAYAPDQMPPAAAPGVEEAMEHVRLPRPRPAEAPTRVRVATVSSSALGPPPDCGAKHAFWHYTDRKKGLRAWYCK
jgi:hypothetical protein